MSGDVHVRICESLGVKFPRATHPLDLLRECFQELDGKNASGNFWFFSCVKGFV